MDASADAEVPTEKSVSRKGIRERRRHIPASRHRRRDRLGHPSEDFCGHSQSRNFENIP